MAGQLHTPGDSLCADITAPKSARYWDATRTFRAAMGQTERQFPAQGSPEGTPTQSESTVHELSYWLADRLHESPASVVAPASPLSIIMPPELLVPELPAVPPEPPEARLPPISSEPPAPPTREMGGEETGRQQRAPLAPQEYWVSTPATKPPKQGPGYGWQVPPTSSQSFGPVAWPTFELLPVPDIPWPPPEPPPMTDIPGPPLELPADPDIPWSPPMLPLYWISLGSRMCCLLCRIFVVPRLNHLLKRTSLGPHPCCPLCRIFLGLGWYCLHRDSGRYGCYTPSPPSQPEQVLRRM